MTRHHLSFITKRVRLRYDMPSLFNINKQICTVKLTPLCQHTHFHVHNVDKNSSGLVNWDTSSL